MTAVAVTHQDTRLTFWVEDAPILREGSVQIQPNRAEVHLPGNPGQRWSPYIICTGTVVRISDGQRSRVARRIVYSSPVAAATGSWSSITTAPAWVQDLWAEHVEPTLDGQW